LRGRREEKTPISCVFHETNKRKKEEGNIPVEKATPEKSYRVIMPSVQHTIKPNLQPERKKEKKKEQKFQDLLLRVFPNPSPSS
jgi:hypothetical protein